MFDTSEHLKIGMVLDDSLDKTDGVQQYVLTLGKYLSDHGHEVHYLVGETSRTDIAALHSLSKNVNVRFNHNRMSVPLPASRQQIRRLLTHEQFDILHVQMPYSPFMAGRVIKAAGPLTGIVGTFHIAPHSRLVSFANWLLRGLVGGSIGRFDEVMAVSPVAQDFAWATFNIETALVPNMVSLDPFYNAKPFAKYDKIPTVVFLGRLVERKGCQYLLRAIERIRKMQLVNTPFRVVLCGTGPMEAELKHFVERHDLQGCVEFAGYVSEDDKPHYLASADVAVFPSTGGESFGIVLVEAMAAARGAVLAGDNPGYASVMGKRPAALFAPRDTEQFAAKLAGLLNSSFDRDEARRWQREYVSQFDVAYVADEVMALYSSALHKRRS